MRSQALLGLLDHPLRIIKQRGLLSKPGLTRPLPDNLLQDKMIPAHIAILLQVFKAQIQYLVVAFVDLLSLGHHAREDWSLKRFTVAVELLLHY
jgi:hypothetical protein